MSNGQVARAFPDQNNSISGVFTISSVYTTYAYAGWSASNISKVVEKIFKQSAKQEHRNDNFQALYDEYGRDGFYVRLIARRTPKKLVNA